MWFFFRFFRKEIERKIERNDQESEENKNQKKPGSDCANYSVQVNAEFKSEYAAQLHNVLLTKHPLHPLADASALWLVQYYASSEAGWNASVPGRTMIRMPMKPARIRGTGLHRHIRKR